MAGAMTQLRRANKPERKGTPPPRLTPAAAPGLIVLVRWIESSGLQTGETTQTQKVSYLPKVTGRKGQRQDSNLIIRFPTSFLPQAGLEIL